jgi:septal ring factor EnvC (AmiA/AmiB activator)
MTERQPVGLVERVRLIAHAVDAICGHTDDAEIAAMRVATFCLALNFHMANEADQGDKARNFISQVRDISGCDGEELLGAVALYAIRSQDIIQEEVERVQQARKTEMDEADALAARIQELEAEMEGMSDHYANHVSMHANELSQMQGVISELREQLASLRDQL